VSVAVGGANQKGEKKVQELTDENFEERVLRSERPVVVDFWAPWCGPCKAVEPVLADLAAAHEEVDVAKMNIDEHPLAASRFGVLAIPTAILFAGGQAQESVVGARARSHYEEAWRPWLSPAAEPA
jgi:thioredoxin 1